MLSLTPFLRNSFGIEYTEQRWNICTIVDSLKRCYVSHDTGWDWKVRDTFVILYYPWVSVSLELKANYSAYPSSIIGWISMKSIQSDVWSYVLCSYAEIVSLVTEWTRFITYYIHNPTWYKAGKALLQLISLLLSPYLVWAEFSRVFWGENG